MGREPKHKRTSNRTRVRAPWTRALLHQSRIDTEEPERSTAGPPSLQLIYLISAREGGWAGALYLDGSTTVDRLLPLSRGILGGL